MEEMVQYEKNKDKSQRVYTYEKAVERYLLNHSIFFESTIQSVTPGQLEL